MSPLHSSASIIPQSDDGASSVVVSSSSNFFTEAVPATVASQRMSINVESPLLRASSSLSFPIIFSLASRVRRLDDLLDALRELRQLFQTATEKEISTHGAEIISLVEVAHDTLTKARIHLWRYSPCPAHFNPHKRLYFLVLKDLKFRKSCFDVSLRRRWGVLVFHLSEDFKWGGTYRDFYASTLGVPRKPTGNVNTTFDATIKEDSPSTESMPPPSAFPTSEGISSLSLLPPRRKAKPLDIVEFFPDVAFSLQARRPMKQRFGIFCTSKTSMFRPLQSIHRGKSLVRTASRHSLISD